MHQIWKGASLKNGAPFLLAILLKNRHYTIFWSMDTIFGECIVVEGWEIN